MDSFESSSHMTSTSKYFFHNDYNWEFCKSYWCKTCGNLFSEEGTLKKHIHTVLEFSKDYKCESCGKSFPDGGKLKRHIKRVHERMNAAQGFNLKVHVQKVRQKLKNLIVINVAIIFFFKGYNLKMFKKKGQINFRYHIMSQYET